MHYKGSCSGFNRLITANRSLSASNVQESWVCWSASSNLKCLYRKQTDSFLIWIYRQAKTLAVIDMAHLFGLDMRSHRKSRTSCGLCEGPSFWPPPQPSSVPPSSPLSPSIASDSAHIRSLPPFSCLHPQRNTHLRPPLPAPSTLSLLHQWVEALSSAVEAWLPSWVAGALWSRTWLGATSPC